MTRTKDQRKTNGHAGTHYRKNGSAGPERFGAHGHARASSARGGIPVHEGHAASDDVSGALLASAATLQFAAGKDHRACAEAALSRADGDRCEVAGDPNEPETGSGTAGEPIPGGEFPLPFNPSEFVDEIHRRIDLFEVWQKLLRSKDPKIQQRAVEKLTEMHYKGAAALADEPQQIVIDIDSAVARRAAEAARK